MKIFEIKTTKGEYISGIALDIVTKGEHISSCKQWKKIVAKLIPNMTNIFSENIEYFYKFT